MSKHIHSLVQDGYVETAPACGDCKWSDPEPQGLLCKRLLRANRASRLAVFGLTKDGIEKALAVDPADVERA